MPSQDRIETNKELTPIDFEYSETMNLEKPSEPSTDQPMDEDKSDADQSEDKVDEPTAIENEAMEVQP